MRITKLNNKSPESYVKNNERMHSKMAIAAVQ